MEAESYEYRPEVGAQLGKRARLQSTAAAFSPRTPATPKFNAASASSPSLYPSLGSFQSPSSSVAQSRISLPRSRASVAAVATSGPATKRRKKTVHEDPHMRVDILAPWPLEVSRRINQSLNVSGGMDSTAGFAWVILDSTLYIWDFTEEVIARCIGLELPSGGGHTFDGKLVCVVQHPADPQTGERVLGLLASSIEGYVIYWPDVTRNAKCETTINFARPKSGRDNAMCSVTRLVAVPPAGYVLSTNQDTLYQLTVIDPLTGSNTLDTRQLEKPVGMLAGIGRMLWWGSVQSVPAISALLPMTSDVPHAADFFALSDNSLQRWQLSLNEPEKLLYDMPLQSMLRPILQASEAEEGYGVNKIWLLDLAKGKSSVFVLAAYQRSVESDRQTIAYCIAELSLGNKSYEQPQLKGDNIRYFEPKTEPTDEETILTQRAVRLVLPPGSPAAFVVWNDLTLVVQLDDYHVDVIPVRLSVFASAVGSTLNRPAEKVPGLFLSPQHGVLACFLYGAVGDSGAKIRGVQPSSESSRISRLSNVSGQTPDSVGQARNDQLLAAYAQYCDGKRPRTESLQNAFKSPQELSAAANAVALAIIDSPPGGTRRWAEDDPSEAASLFVGPQLEEKRQKYEYLINFLKETGLWDKISSATKTDIFSNLERLQAAIDLNDHNNQISTDLPLPPELTAPQPGSGLLISRLTTPLTSADQAAKLRQHNDLRNFRARAKEVFERALLTCLNRRQYSRESWTGTGMSPQDYFYSSISNIEEFLEHAQAVELESIGGRSVRPTISSPTISLSNLGIGDTQKATYVIREVNQIFEAILLAAPKCRQNMGPERTYPQLYASLSWVASTRVRELSFKQIQITTDLIKQLLAFAPSPSFAADSGFDWSESVGILLMQLYHISNSLLDGYREEMDVRRLSGEHTKADDDELRQKFFDARASVTEPFRLVLTSQIAGDKVEEESVSIVESSTRRNSLHRIARSKLLELAERHMDFDVLIGICESQGDEARLQEYLRRFREYGFAQQLFQWYMANGKKTKLLSMSSDYKEELTQFLAPHPSLLWIHSLGIGQYKSAAHALSDLADQENRFLGKTKTLLSLAKLSSLAAMDADNVSECEQFVAKKNQQLYLIEVQIAHRLQPPVAKSKGLIAEGARLKQQRRLGLDQATVGGARQVDRLDDDESWSGIQKYQKNLEGQPLVPMSVQQIVEAFVGPLRDDEGQLGRQAAPTSSQIILALDVFNHSTLLRTPQQSEELLRGVVRRALRATDWVTLGREWEAGRLTDLQARDKMMQTPLFQAACHSVSRQLPILDVYSQEAAAITYADQEHTEVLHRIFKTLDALLQEHRTNPTSASVRLEGSHFDEGATTGPGSMADSDDADAMALEVGPASQSGANIFMEEELEPSEEDGDDHGDFSV